ncbi:MAG: alpha/beta fold hydrolase [Deltaproteobacteria bacterium]|nr:alpha/beta fold hydrolase [Deltaproteobacteria bacterium]
MPFAQVGPITLAYEDPGPGVPLLLIMGIGAQLVLWPEGLLERLRAEGFAPLIYDHRDLGQSTWMTGAGRPAVGALLARRAAGLPVPAPYTLSDLAADAAGLMDAVGWADAHVLGVSMGGMVAQHLVIEHPRRVRSLTSVMSTTGARFAGLPTPGALRALLTPRPPTEQGAVEWFIRFQQRVVGDAFPYDPVQVEATARKAFSRGANPDGFLRQFAAILASGDRTRALAAVRAPTLVLHGEADPLVPVSGGRATARAIPGARLATVPGWGHGLPPGVWPWLVDAVAAHARG